MTQEELIALYNPANAKNLTDEQLNNLQNLTDSELKALAEAYPNQASNNTYLVLKNKNVPDNKQTYQLSTFANLYSLRTRNNRSEFVPISFRSRFKYPGVVNTNQRIEKGKVQDLTKTEAKNAEGLKTNEPQTAKPVTEQPANLRVEPDANDQQNNADNQQPIVNEQPNAADEKFDDLTSEAAAAAANRTRTRTNR